MRIIFLMLVTITLAFLASPHVYAQKNIPSNFYSNSPLWWAKCAFGQGGPVNQPCAITPSDLISILLPNLLVLAGIIFFLLILGGGFMMIKSAGGDANAQETAKAKNAVTFAVIGFLLVISAYFILQIVKTITGVNFITPPTL